MLAEDRDDLSIQGGNSSFAPTELVAAFQSTTNYQRNTVVSKNGISL